MNATFEDQEFATKEKPVDIVLNGKKVGYVEPSTNYTQARPWFYAQIKMVNSDFHIGLVQGHGASREEALRNAFTRSRKDAQDYLKNLDALESEIYPETGEENNGTNTF